MKPAMLRYNQKETRAQERRKQCLTILTFTKPVKSSTMIMIIQTARSFKTPRNTTKERKRENENNKNIPGHARRNY